MDGVAVAGGHGAGGAVLAVVGARGGSGASTLAALVARRLAGHGRVALVDLHLSGGGVEVLLGIEDAGGARWADLGQVRGEVAPGDLEGVLPRWGGVEVLGPDRRGGHLVDAACVQALGTALRAGGRSVVLDLPPAALVDEGMAQGLAAWATAPGAGPTGTVLVTTQDVLGVAGALALRSWLPTTEASLVLRRRARARVAPAEAAHVLDLPLRGLLPTEAGLAGAVERGLGPTVGRTSRVGRLAAEIARTVEAPWRTAEPPARLGSPRRGRGRRAGRWSA